MSGASADKPLPGLNDLTRPFYDACARGELHLQRCNDCQAWVFYPRHWCTACYSPSLQWQAVSGEGELFSYSVVSYAPYPCYDDVPYVLATVRLQEGPQIMTNLIDCDPSQVRVGMAVRVTFEHRGDLSVPQFRPA